MGSLSSPAMDRTLSLFHSSERSHCHQLASVSPYAERRREWGWRYRCDCTDWEWRCRDRREAHCILAWTLEGHLSSIVLRWREHCRDLRADPLCVVVRWDLCNDWWGEPVQEIVCLLEVFFDVFRLNRIDEGLVCLWIGLASESLVFVIFMRGSDDGRCFIYRKVPDDDTDTERNSSRNDRRDDQELMKSSYCIEKLCVVKLTLLPMMVDWWSDRCCSLARKESYLVSLEVKLLTFAKDTKRFFSPICFTFDLMSIRSASIKLIRWRANDFVRASKYNTRCSSSFSYPADRNANNQAKNWGETARFESATWHE